VPVKPTDFVVLHSIMVAALVNRIASTLRPAYSSTFASACRSYVAKSERIFSMKSFAVTF